MKNEHFSMNYLPILKFVQIFKVESTSEPITDIHK